jgi:voltage-gated potassium channel Kch
MVFIKTLITFLQDPEYRDLVGTTLFILLLGTLVYHNLEGWGYIDSLYFSLITLTTIGYGDFSPQTTEGKLFTIFYILLGIGIILAFVNTLYHHFQNEQQHEKEKKDKEHKNKDKKKRKWMF